MVPIFCDEVTSPFSISCTRLSPFSMKPVTPYSVGLTYHTISCSIAARGCGRGMDRAPGDRGIAGSGFLEYQDTAGTAQDRMRLWEFLSFYDIIF